MRTPLVGVDVLRHLLTLAVIYQHMPSRARYSEAVNAHIAHWVPLIDGAVACFFLLSGFFSRPGMTSERVVRQARRLLLPYLIFSLAYAVIQAAIGKLDIGTGLIRTITAAGAGPQLYFLPYLFLISVAVELLLDRVPPTYRRAATRGLVLTLFAAFLSLPTPSSTGPELRLLALYALAYTLGVYRARHAQDWESLAAAGIALVALALLPWQVRLWDLAAIILLSEIAIRVSRLIGRSPRLPGSGGVYLLHTPILNYAISAALLKVGLHDLANVYGAMLVTYAVALVMTLILIRLAPAVRPYILE